LLGIEIARRTAGEERRLAFSDKVIACRDCGTQFTFTSGEQEFYKTKGLLNEPTRCPSCRSQRRSSVRDSNSTTTPAGGVMSADGYVRYGAFASFGGRTPRQMHPAMCAECGMWTEVPFVPRGDRPVYCSACYSKVKGPAPTTPTPAGSQ
jgi:CxxC-x17-CxxC domain-containing protein